MSNGKKGLLLAINPKKQERLNVTTAGLSEKTYTALLTKSSITVIF